MVERKKIVKERRAKRESMRMTFSMVSVILSFVALSAVLKSDLNFVTNPGVGSFLISTGISGILLGSVMDFFTSF